MSEMCVLREGGMVIATRCSSNLLRLDLSGSASSDNPDDSIDDAGMIYSLFIQWLGIDCGFAYLVGIT